MLGQFFSRNFKFDMLHYISKAGDRYMNEQRKVIYDDDLGIEAYQFMGIMQRFDTHFHDHYVIGIIEKGKRRLTYNGTDYYIDQGEIVLFNPRDMHACEQIDDQTLDFRCLNVPEKIMSKIMKDLTGDEILPKFETPVIIHDDIFAWIHNLHELIMQKESMIAKEEALYFLMEQLLILTVYSILPNEVNDDRIDRVCRYIEENYKQHISLKDMAEITCMNKYYLLRAFTRKKGITPYRYVQTIRINQARELLQKGATPIDIAVSIGFSDQSHFTNTFREFIGVTPKQYQNIFIAKGEKHAE